METQCPTDATHGWAALMAEILLSLLPWSHSWFSSHRAVANWSQSSDSFHPCTSFVSILTAWGPVPSLCVKQAVTCPKESLFVRVKMFYGSSPPFAVLPFKVAAVFFFSSKGVGLAGVHPTPLLWVLTLFKGVKIQRGPRRFGISSLGVCSLLSACQTVTDRVTVVLQGDFTGKALTKKG